MTCSKAKAENRATRQCQLCSPSDSTTLTLQLRLTPQERLFALIDDIHVVCSPDRVLPIFQALEFELWVHSRIQIQRGKTQLWNKGGGWETIGSTRVEAWTQMLSFGEVTGVFPRTSRA